MQMLSKFYICGAVLAFDCFVYRQNATFTGHGHYAGDVYDIIIGRLMYGCLFSSCVRNYSV